MTQQQTSQSLEHHLKNDVTIYGESAVATKIKDVIAVYLRLWKDHRNVVDVSESEWMNISFLNDWRENYKSEQVRVYSVSQVNWELIDKTFDKLHEQNHLKWTKMTTLFTYSCFIIWKTIKDTQKECVVMNIRALNKIMMSDTYSVSSQINILAAVQEAKYILTVDCASFFYQWWVKSEHHHCLRVASHCEQKTFKVAVMGYWNFSTYIQRIIDWLLCSHHNFTHIYVDDIVIFFSFLNEHIYHLQKVFDTLLKWDICLSLQKFFLVYSSVNLSNQYVNALSLTTAEEKLVTIQNLKFSMTLSQLKHYLELTEYL